MGLLLQNRLHPQVVVESNANPTRNMAESIYYEPVLNELKESLGNYDSALTGICIVPTTSNPLYFVLVELPVDEVLLLF